MNDAPSEGHPPIQGPFQALDTDTGPGSCGISPVKDDAAGTQIHVLTRDMHGKRNIYSTVEMLEKIGAVARAGRLLAMHHDAGIKAIGEALEHWTITDDDISLEKLLGLSGHGGIGRRKAVANAERDRMLCALMRDHPVWSDRQPSFVAREMRGAFDRYQSSRWLRDRRQIAAPSAEPFTTFWRLLQADLRMPQVDRLRQVLSRGIQDPV